MDDRSIFIIGFFVTLLFLAGIVLTVIEFRKMERRPEDYGVRGDFQPPRSTPP